QLAIVVILIGHDPSFCRCQPCQPLSCIVRCVLFYSRLAPVFDCVNVSFSAGCGLYFCGEVNLMVSIHPIAPRRLPQGLERRRSVARVPRRPPQGPERRRSVARVPRRPPQGPERRRSVAREYPDDPHKGQRDGAAWRESTPTTPTRGVATCSLTLGHSS